MQVRVFAIPMDGDAEAMDEVNAFLRSQKVLSVEKVAVADHGRHYWSLCVEYLPRRPAESALPRTGTALDANRARLDYREVLSKDEFDRFAKLRALRKMLAEAEGVPVYTILTNAQCRHQQVDHAAVAAHADAAAQARTCRSSAP